MRVECQRSRCGRVSSTRTAYFLFLLYRPKRQALRISVAGTELSQSPRRNAFKALCRPSTSNLLHLTNIRFHLRDFVNEGSGLADSGVDYVMLFNILHAEDPGRLLREAYRILASNGLIGVMHWNYDPKTPRGPSLEIRPRPEDCRKWMTEENFKIATDLVDLPPYHYGIKRILTPAPSNVR